MELAIRNSLSPGIQGVSNHSVQLGLGAGLEAGIILTRTRLTYDKIYCSVTSMINRIKDVRKRVGLSQVELADKVGVSQQALSQWESESATPALDYLPKLIRALGVSLFELFPALAENDEVVSNRVRAYEAAISDFNNAVQKVRSGKLGKCKHEWHRFSGLTNCKKCGMGQPHDAEQT